MFFAFLFSLVLFLFKGAFSTNFFSDDFYFLKISRVDNIGGFINFFSPFRDTSYKPVATEVFYFLSHLMGDNLFVIHTIKFLCYFAGVYFLYKVILFASRKKIL